jgi:hypothetical protein
MGAEAVLEFARPGWLVLIAAAVLLVVLSLRGRRRAQARHVTAGTLRMLALAALVVALAGPLAGSYSRHTDVVFVLDVSRSIAREAIADALAFINLAITGKESEARMGLVVFGADAAVESLVRGGSEPMRDNGWTRIRNNTSFLMMLPTPAKTF